MPCNARPTSRPVNPPGSADTTHPISTTPTVTRITGRRSRPSPSLPSTGAVTAPTSSEMVSAHCDAARETWSTTTMVGSSGAPRAATAVDTTPRNTSTGTSSRDAVDSVVTLTW